MTNAAIHSCVWHRRRVHFTKRLRLLSAITVIGLPIVTTFPVFRGSGRRITQLFTQETSHHSTKNITTLDNIERVFCLSDLHTDHADNFYWLEAEVLRTGLKKSDLVVIAGDISHDYTRFEKSIRVVADRSQVFFVPGNHEAWVAKDDEVDDSFEKLGRLEQLCRSYGIHVGPLHITGSFPLWVVPLESWYDGTLSFDEELGSGLDKWPWVDFAKCKWTDRFPPFPNSSPYARIPEGLVEFLHDRDRKKLIDVARLVSPSDGLMTVSHFLPNQQCLPDWCDLDVDDFDIDAWLTHGAGKMSAKFAKVAGTELLDREIRSMEVPKESRRIHVFGHSHRPKDFVYDSIRYIHNPLGKPREREIEMVNPNVSFQLVWETNTGEITGPEIIRYFEQYGKGLEATKLKLKARPPGRYQINSQELKPE